MIRRALAAPFLGLVRFAARRLMARERRMFADLITGRRAPADAALDGLVPAAAATVAMLAAAWIATRLDPTWPTAGVEDAYLRRTANAVADAMEDNHG